MTLMRWGDRHLADRPPVVFEHSCGADLDPVVVCRGCGEEPRDSTLTARFADPTWTATGPAHD